jgi:hypothetical protein
VKRDARKLELNETEMTRDDVREDGLLPLGIGWRVLDARPQHHTSWQRVFSPGKFSPAK